MKPYVFTVTEEHLALLREFCVGWNDAEYGAPEVNPKRPYGNSSGASDVHEVLTGETNYDLDEDREKYCNRVHRETEYALEICLRVGEFKAGTFARRQYRSDWCRVDEKEQGHD